MVRNKRFIQRYCRRIQSLLPCSRKQRTEIMRQIRESVEEYAAEHPEAAEKQLEEQFGSPASVAASYVESSEPVQILLHLRRRRRAVITVSLVLLAALLSWFLWETVIIAREKKEADAAFGSAFIVTEIHELPPDYIVIPDVNEVDRFDPQIFEREAPSSETVPTVP